MKTTFTMTAKTVLVFLIASVGISCSDNGAVSPEKIIELGESAYQIAPGTVGYTITQDKLLKITVLEINDSRCAEDVTCIWAGEAKANFQIEELKKIFTLCLTSDCNTQEIEYEDRQFKITLVDITPYPNSNKPDVTKTAVFKVEEI